MLHLSSINDYFYGVFKAELYFGYVFVLFCFKDSSEYKI
jgi:hypothetical protein